MPMISPGPTAEELPMTTDNLEPDAVEPVSDTG